MAASYMTLENCEDYLNVPFLSRWQMIEQSRIDAFGDAIDDHDPHHVDPDWAREHSPWGKTIAFGWLTTALTTSMLYEVFRYRYDGDPVTYGYPASYGFNRLRLISPVVVGSRIRGEITLTDVSDAGYLRRLYTFDMKVLIEGEDKPALAGEYLFMWLQDEAAG